MEVCESLYNGLNLPIRWDLGGGGGLGKAASAASASRTLLRMPGERPYFQRGPLRGRTRHLAAEIARPLKRVRPAGRSRARAWIDCVRCALSVRERELYPIALASEGEVYEVPVGRGVRIVLFGMLAERRLPIETDYGAFVVRNGMPIGYGVAALLFDRVEIAVNIFPTFRQGESSFVFEQFARLFRHQFGSRVFLVERYQLGHENDEGLDAGSFWFYYKLGFRPVDPKVRALADAEASRLARERGARTGRRMLKRLARSNVAFAPDGALPSAEREISLTRIGLAVSRSIEERFAGDKRQAERVCAGEAAKILGASGRGEWSADERAAFARLSPLVVILPGIEGWPARDRRALIRLLRAKGSRLEGTYAILACGNARFQGALEALGSVR